MLQKQPCGAQAPATAAATAASPALETQAHLRLQDSSRLWAQAAARPRGGSPVPVPSSPPTSSR